MLDVFKEDLISLHDLPKHLPASRSGRKLSLATVTRWSKRGVHGVILETVQVGASRFTSKTAVSEFCARVAAARDGRAAPTPELAATARAAAAELDSLGW